MHHMSAPQYIHLMRQSVKPVIEEINAQKETYPGEDIIGDGVDAQ